VSDILAARAELIARGVDVSEVVHRDGPGPARLSGPDGNDWLLQEVTVPLPERVEPHGLTFASSADLVAALRRAAAAHGEHEKRTRARDPAWPDWYGEYLVREQAGEALPS
jgi:hypothetical protein